MSELIQRKADEQANARRQREKSARERAEANRQRGERILARLHDEAADLQADAAEDAERLAEADRQAEGDQRPKSG